MAWQTSGSIRHDAAAAAAHALARAGLLTQAASVAAATAAPASIPPRHPGHEQLLLERVIERFGPRLDGHVFGLWGPEAVDLLADSPLVAGLLRRGATVRAFDPLALPDARNACCAYVGLRWVDSPLAVAEQGSALLLLGGGAPLRASDLAVLRGLMAHPVLFDARRQCDPSLSAALGFVLVGAARPVSDD